MSKDALYVYGVIDKSHKEVFPGIGIWEGEDVYCMPFKDISAVVSRTPFEEYDPTEENTLAHEAVIQALLKKDLEIAPMRFCTVLGGERDVMKLLSSGYAAFKLNLLKVKNKQEYDVKAFLLVENLKKEVSDDEELVQKSQAIAKQFYELLDDITDKSVLSDQVTREMILNASFLVHKEKVDHFYSKINEFDKNFTDKIKIRISGPTAPYNFVSMPIR
jgi:hypothetical protein